MALANRLQLKAYNTSYWKLFLVLFIGVGAIMAIPLAIGDWALEQLTHLLS